MRLHLHCAYRFTAAASSVFKQHMGRGAKKVGPGEGEGRKWGWGKETDERSKEDNEDGSKSNLFST